MMNWMYDPNSKSDHILLEENSLSISAQNDIIFNEAFTDLTDWLETGYGNWRSDTLDESRYIAGQYGTYNLVATADGCVGDCILTLRNPIDLTSYTSATLEFHKFVDNSIDRDEYLKVELGDGGTYTEIFSWTDGEGDTDRWSLSTYDLSDYLNSDQFTIRFITLQSSRYEDVGVDNVKIIGTTSTSIITPPRLTGQPYTTSYSDDQNVNKILIDNFDQQEYVGALFVDKNMTITDISLSVTLTHTYPRDLYGYLVAPNNEKVLVISGLGRSPVTSHTLQISTSDRPNLDMFINDNAHGVWRLTVGDYAGVDIGHISNWQLDISGTGVTNSDTITSRVVGFWSDPNPKYYCDRSLTYLVTTTNVEPCGDITSAANRWNAISGSTFTTTKSADKPNTVVISATSIDMMTLATVTIPASDKYYTTDLVTMKINTLFNWGDVSAGDHSRNGASMFKTSIKDRPLYDYNSVVIHEFGHVAGLDHSKSLSSTMYNMTRSDRINTYIDDEDKKIMELLY